MKRKLATEGAATRRATLAAMGAFALGGCAAAVGVPVAGAFGTAYLKRERIAEIVDEQFGAKPDEPVDIEKIKEIVDQEIAEFVANARKQNWYLRDEEIYRLKKTAVKNYLKILKDANYPIKAQ